MSIKSGVYKALTILVLLLAGCASLGGYHDPPRVSLVSIEPLDMALLEQRYALQLRIINPNGVVLPVGGLDYSIEINRREFAYGVSLQSVTIPAHGEAILDVEVISNLLNLLRQVQELGADGKQVIEYRISGKLSLNHSPVRLPFEYSGELNWLPART